MLLLRAAPCIIYMPSFDAWWSNVPEQTRSHMSSLVRGLPDDHGILLLATAIDPETELDDAIVRLFKQLKFPDDSYGNTRSDSVVELTTPSQEQHMAMFRVGVRQCLVLSGASCCSVLLHYLSACVTHVLLILTLYGRRAVWRYSEMSPLS